MPMGASFCSDVYQYKVDGHLEGIENCTTIANDIIMYGFKNDGSDHDITDKKVMEKARSVGMWFNHNKCKFRQKQVKFFRLILTRDVIIPNPSKTEVLKCSQSEKMRNCFKVF